MADQKSSEQDWMSSEEDWMSMHMQCTSNNAWHIVWVQ